MKKNIPLYFIILFSFFFSHFSIAQPVNGNSLLWRVSGNGLNKPSYLYGTMHSRDKRVFHFADSVMNCFERCTGFAMELIVDNDTKQSVMEGILLDSGQTLKDLMFPAQYDSLNQYCQQHLGTDLMFFNKVKPIYVMVLLMQSGDTKNASGDKGREFFLDEYLQHQAQAQLKNVYALEKTSDQLAVFDVLSLKEQVTYLMKSISEPEEDDSTEMEKMILHYTNNELDDLTTMENDFKMPEKVFDKLLTYRNTRMADKIDSLAHIQSTFFAFGAAHLPGNGGIISLLRKKGFRVEPVTPAFNCYMKDGWYACNAYDNSYSATFPEAPTLSKSKIKEVISVDCRQAKSASNFFKFYSYSVESGQSTPTIKDFYQLEYPLQANFKGVKAKTKKETGLKFKADEITIDCKGDKEKTFITFQNATKHFVVVIYSDSVVNEVEKNRFLNSIKLNPS